MAQPSYTASATSRLAQDLFQSGDLILKQASATFSNIVATYTDQNGEARALVLLNDGMLYHVYRNPSTDSGWNVDPTVTSLGELAEVVCGTDQVSGTTTAFFTTAEGPLYSIQLTDGGWTDPAAIPIAASSCDELAVAYTADQGILTLFAIGSDGTLIIISQQSSVWTSAAIGLDNNLFNAIAPPIVTYLSEPVWLVAFCDQGLVNVYEGQGTSTRTSSQIALPNGAQANQVVLTFPHEGNRLLLVADDHGKLYSTLANSAAVPVALGNPTAVSSASGFATDDTFTVLGIDETGTLWSFVQTGWAADGSAVWSAGTPFVATVAGVSFDSSLNAPGSQASPGQEAFVLRADFTLELIEIGGGSGWRPLPIRNPTPGVPNSVVTYQVRISLFDQDNIPAPAVAVTVTASSPAYVWYHCCPN
jgi:hypothetical protein